MSIDLIDIKIQFFTLLFNTSFQARKFQYQIKLVDGL
jgi:hypothetical protein